MWKWWQRAEGTPACLWREVRLPWSPESLRGQPHRARALLGTRCPLLFSQEGWGVFCLLWFEEWLHTCALSRCKGSYETIPARESSAWKWGKVYFPGASVPAKGSTWRNSLMIRIAKFNSKLPSQIYTLLTVCLSPISPALNMRIFKQHVSFLDIYTKWYLLLGFVCIDICI